MVDEAKRPTVTVNCSGIPMGVRLNTFDPHDPRTVEIRPGQNTVDKEFWDNWVAANPQSSILTGGQVSVLKEEDKDGADPWTARGV